MNNARKIAAGPIIPLLLLALAGAFIMTLQHQPASKASADAPGPQKVQVIHATEFVPSSTLKDWAKYADHVVVVTVTAERKLGAAGSAESDGGVETIGREVDFSVGETLWSADTAAKSAPTSFSAPEFGWIRQHDGTLVEMAPEGGARLEVGHSYLVALTWRARQCSPDGEGTPARWMVIGSEAALPADKGVIGVGEFEGSTTDQAESDETGSVLEEFAADPVDALAPALDDVDVKESNFLTRTDPDCGAA